MSDDVTFARLVQYIEAQGITAVDTTRFSLVLDPSSGKVVLGFWAYSDLERPDLDQLQTTMPRSQVLATSNLKKVREIRGKMLVDTDYMFLGDYMPRSESDNLAVKTFRQALRDVPQNIATPDDFTSCASVFPLPPPVVSFLVAKYPEIFIRDAQ
jgi:hypothetical protein